MKLACNRLKRISLASQRASALSVFRPGTFLTWAALTKNTVKVSSRRLETGFQYSPVLSMATWVMLASVSQSAKLSRSRVMVPNVLSSIIPSASRPVGSGIMRQAVILFLWTSKPAHRVNTTSISHLHALMGLAGYPEQKRLPCVLHFPGGSWQQFVVPAGIQVQFCHRLGAPIRTRPHTQSFRGI